MRNLEDRVGVEPIGGNLKGFCCPGLALASRSLLVLGRGIEPAILRLSSACPAIGRTEHIGELVRSRISPFQNGFTDHIPEPPDFPTPYWCIYLELNQGLHITNVLHDPSCYRCVWRKSLSTIQIPRGTLRLAGGPNNLASCLFHMAGS